MSVTICHLSVTITAYQWNNCKGTPASKQYFAWLCKLVSALIYCLRASIVWAILKKRYWTNRRGYMDLDFYHVRTDYGLGLPSLELRRLQLDLIYCYKNRFWLGRC